MVDKEHYSNLNQNFNFRSHFFPTTNSTGNYNTIINPSTTYSADLNTKLPNPSFSQTPNYMQFTNHQGNYDNSLIPMGYPNYFSTGNNNGNMRQINSNYTDHYNIKRNDPSFFRLENNSNIRIPINPFVSINNQFDIRNQINLPINNYGSISFNYQNNHFTNNPIYNQNLLTNPSALHNTNFKNMGNLEQKYYYLPDNKVNFNPLHNQEYSKNTVSIMMKEANIIKTCHVANTLNRQNKNFEISKPKKHKKPKTNIVQRLERLNLDEIKNCNFSKAKKKSNINKNNNNLIYKKNEMLKIKQSHPKIIDKNEESIILYSISSSSSFSINNYTDNNYCDDILIKNHKLTCWKNVTTITEFVQSDCYVLTNSSKGTSKLQSLIDRASSKEITLILDLLVNPPNQKLTKTNKKKILNNESNSINDNTVSQESLKFFINKFTVNWIQTLILKLNNSQFTKFIEYLKFADEVFLEAVNNAYGHVIFLFLIDFTAEKNDNCKNLVINLISSKINQVKLNFYSSSVVSHLLYSFTFKQLVAIYEFIKQEVVSLSLNPISQSIILEFITKSSELSFFKKQIIANKYFLTKIESLIVNAEGVFVIETLIEMFGVGVCSQFVSLLIERLFEYGVKSESCILYNKLFTISDEVSIK